MAKPWIALPLAVLPALAHAPQAAQSPSVENSAGGAVVSAPTAAQAGASDGAPAGAEPLVLGSWLLRHRDPVTFLEFGPAGLYSGGMEGDVLVWDPDEPRRLDLLPRTLGSVLDAAPLPGGEFVVTAAGGDLFAWKAGGERREVAAAVGSLVSASPDGARACVGGRDMTARLVDLATGEVAHSVPLGTLLAGPSAFTPDGAHVVILGVNRNKKLKRGGTEEQASSVLFVVDAATGEIVREIPSQNRALKALAIAPGQDGGPEIVTLDEQGALGVWRLGDGTLRAAFEIEPVSEGTALALTPDGGAALARTDGVVVVLDLADGAERARATVSPRPLSYLAVAPDGGTLAVSTGAEILLLELPSLGVRVAPFRHAGPVSTVAWSPDGERLVTGSYDHDVRLWSAADGAGLDAFEANAGFVFGVGFLAEGVASGGQDGVLRAFDGEGVARYDLLAHSRALTSLAISPDGSRIATAGADGVVQVFDAETGEQRAAAGGLPGIELRLAWTPDGERLVVAAADVRVLDAETCEMITTLGRPSAPVTALAVSPDGTTAAAGLANRQIALYPLAGGAPRFLHGHAGRISAVAFSRAGLLASAAAGENAVFLWDVASEKKITELSGFQRQALGLAFDPAGKRLAGASMDGTARVWTLVE